MSKLSELINSLTDGDAKMKNSIDYSKMTTRELIDLIRKEQEKMDELLGKIQDETNCSREIMNKTGNTDGGITVEFTLDPGHEDDIEAFRTLGSELASRTARAILDAWWGTHGEAMLAAS
jgi:DNA topoisomerase VI subunit A